MNRIIALSILGLLLAAIGCGARVERPQNDLVQSSRPEQGLVFSAQDVAMLHNKTGALLFVLGDLEWAARELREAIRLSPERPIPHNNLGMVLHAQGNFTGAGAEFQEAIRLNPRDAVARSNRGFAFFEQGDLGSALEQWEAAVGLDQHLAGAWAGQALGLLAFGKVDLAVQSYSQALQLDHRYADVEYLQRVRRWRPGAVGQAEAVLRLMGARDEVSPQKVMT